jgi:alkanesulfonate monooxygenase SsuD/methylene tetrahydromethanopterin reductase-like flavin-dependent oxidoreductase (luciferase family)
VSQLPLALALGGSSPAAAAELAARAEAAGVERLLISEQPGGPDSFAMAAFVLARTERIQVGPGLVSALDRHPLVLARQAATCEQVGPGRTLLGLGRSSRSYIEGVLGLPYLPATERMAEVLTVLRLLLSGDEVSFQGRFVNIAKASLSPSPKTRVPLLLGASGERTLELSGRLSDGAILNGGASPEYVTWARSVIVRGAVLGKLDREGPAPGGAELGAWCLTAVERDGSWTPGLERLRSQLAFNLMEPDSGRALIAHSGLSGTSRDLLLVARQHGPAALSELLEDFEILSQLAVVGGPSECLARLRQYLEAGASFLVLQPAAMKSLLEL